MCSAAKLLVEILRRPVGHAPLMSAANRVDGRLSHGAMRARAFSGGWPLSVVGFLLPTSALLVGSFTHRVASSTFQSSAEPTSSALSFARRSRARAFSMSAADGAGLRPS